LAEYQITTEMPLENMYFITIDEYDFFIQLIKEGKETFTTGLLRAKEDDMKPQTGKFDFYLHLTSWGHKLNLPDYINTESDQMISKLMNAVQV